MQITKTAGSLKRPTSTPAFQGRHGSRAEAKVPESKTDSSGNAEISLEQLYKIFCKRYEEDLAMILEPEAISYMQIIIFERFLNSYTMQFAAKCTAKAFSFAHDFRIAKHASHLVFSGQGVVADIHFNVTHNQEFEFWYNGANENKRIVEKTDFEAALNLYSQLIEAKKMLDPMLPTGLTIERSRSQPCLKFVVQTQPLVTQHLFCVTDGNLYFPSLDKGNLCITDDIEFYSPHKAIQLLSSRYGLDRASAPLIQESINTSLDITEPEARGFYRFLPLLNVQQNENAFHLVNQQTQEACPFDLIFAPHLCRWKIVSNDQNTAAVAPRPHITFKSSEYYNCKKQPDSYLLDDLASHVFSYLSQSLLSKYRCISKSNSNQVLRLCNKVEWSFSESNITKFRNANVISFLKSKLGSCVDILRTPNDRWPYSIQKSGHQNHPHDPTYQRFLFNFRRSRNGLLQLHLANVFEKNGCKALSIVQFLNRIGVDATPITSA